MQQDSKEIVNLIYVRCRLGSGVTLLSGVSLASDVCSAEDSPKENKQPGNTYPDADRQHHASPVGVLSRPVADALNFLVQGLFCHLLHCFRRANLLLRDVVDDFAE